MAEEEVEPFKLPEDADLTLKQRLFVEEWVKDGNGTRAALAAGYSKGDPDSAAAEACRLLRNAKVSKYIDEVSRDAAKRAGVTVERILREQVKLAFLDADNFFHKDGTPRALTDVDADSRAAIAGFEIVEQQCDDGSIMRTKKYKLYDKNRALDGLSKALGMIVEKRELTGKDGGAIMIDRTEKAVDDFLLDVLGAEGTTCD